MSNNQYKKIYIDWWNIRKSTIYTVASAIVALALVSFGLWYASNHNWFVPVEAVDAPKDAARIMSFEGEVRITRAATRETLLVTKATWIAAGDIIQTQSDGRAVIQMIDGSVYSVRPNSTVIVRDTTSLFGGKNVRVRVDDGQLNVRTEEQPENTQNIVELGESENQIGPRTDASFNADGPNGGEIRVSRGGIETTLGGEQTTITENQYATVNGGKLSERERLLAPPRLVSPSNSEQIVDTSGGGVTVNFAWQDPEGNPASSFHLQVARSAIFASDSIMVDRGDLQAHEFRLASLVPGTYYWRLKATGRSGQTTNWNDQWKFSIVRGGGGAAIDAVDWRVDRIGGNVYLISGRTQPGMSVRSQNRSVYAGPDGAFQLQVTTASIETAVEISDERGSRSGFVISLRRGNVVRRY
jgi:hypothetical protein